MAKRDEDCPSSSQGHIIEEDGKDIGKDVIKDIFQILSVIELHGSQPSIAHKEEPHNLKPLEPRHSKGKERARSEIHGGGDSTSKGKRNASEHRRRARINASLNTLRDMTPGSYKRDQASIIDDTVSYIKYLKNQTDVLSMMRMSPVAATAGELASNPPTMHHVRTIIPAYNTYPPRPQLQYQPQIEPQLNHVRVIGPELQFFPSNLVNQHPSLPFVLPHEQPLYTPPSSR